MKPIRSTSGLTLVEVMVGLVLVSIVAAGAFASFSSGISFVEDARDVTRVSQILQGEVERLRKRNWSDFNDETQFRIGEKQSFTIDPAFEEAFPGRYRGFRRLELAPPLPGQEASESDKIEVVLTVFWNKGTREVSRSFRTFFVRNGLNDYYVRVVQQ